MPNFVRACFCSQKIINLYDLQSLLEILKKYRCFPVDEPLINLGRWNEQKIVWEIDKSIWESRLNQFSYNNIDECTVISFDVDNQLFLPKGNICYIPNNDKVFYDYKSLLIDLIKEIKPNFGQIDLDVDLFCCEIYATPIASWGNYFSNRFLKLWNRHEIKILTQLVDEYIEIDNLGILTFINPLTANREWSNTHENLEKLIRSH
ncbi:MAG: hypothetical protein JW908_09665 [Anaerolineales bacterium]|nr:hypothetical protein [Anaerolineales bacterium]